MFRFLFKRSSCYALIIRVKRKEFLFNLTVILTYNIFTNCNHCHNLYNKYSDLQLCLSQFNFALKETYIVS